MNGEKETMKERTLWKRTQELGSQQSNISQTEFGIERNEFNGSNKGASRQNEREDVQQSNIKRLGEVEEDERKREKMMLPEETLELVHIAKYVNMQKWRIRSLPKEALDQYWSSGPSSEKVKVLIEARNATNQTPAGLLRFLQDHFSELVTTAERTDIPRLIRKESKELLDQYWNSGPSSEKVKILIKARDATNQIPIGLSDFLQDHFDELIAAADRDDIPKLIRKASKGWLDQYWSSGPSSEKVKVLIEARDETSQIPTVLMKFWEDHFDELVAVADRDDMPSLIRKASKKCLDQYWSSGPSSEKVKVLIEARGIMKRIPTVLAKFWEEHFDELLDTADCDDRARLIRKAPPKWTEKQLVNLLLELKNSSYKK